MVEVEGDFAVEEVVVHLLTDMDPQDFDIRPVGLLDLLLMYNATIYTINFAPQA